MTKARDIANSTTTLDVDGTIKLDGNYPVGSNNVALGNAALDSNVSGSSNTAIGADALTANTASNNTAVGYQSLYANTTGTRNTGVGFQALQDNTEGDDNTAVGEGAGRENTTGVDNTFVGRYAGRNVTTGSYNTGIGKLSGYAGSGAVNYNTSVGYGSLQNNAASNNTAVGYQAGLSNTTGSYNTAIGQTALYSNTTAMNNTAIGFRGLYSNTIGTLNSAISHEALYSNTTGNYNTAVGAQALINNTDASKNTALGYQAGYTNTTGYENVFVGYQSGYNNTGYANNYIGYGAGVSMTSGNANTILGKFSGNQGGLDIRTSSNNIVLSDGDGNPRVHIDSNGRLGIAYTSPSARLHVQGEAGNDTAIFRNGSDSGNGISIQRTDGTEVGSINWASSSTSFNTSSDHRLKENVVELTGATDRLKQLEPKRFNFIADADTTVDGFLAHEVQAIVPEAITGTKDEVDADGNPVYQGIDQSKLVPLLVATIKELEARIAALEAN